jgi:hypothetical protein
MGVPNHLASGKFLYRENTTLLIATRNITGVWHCSILLCAPISLTVWYAVQCLYEVYSISGDICTHRNLISPICPFASHSPLSKQNIQAYEYMVAILYTHVSSTTHHQSYLLKNLCITIVCLLVMSRFSQLSTTRMQKWKFYLLSIKTCF